MAGLRFRQLAEAFTAALERAGATVLMIGSSETRPASLRIIVGDSTLDCKVYLWTVTPGGGGEGVRPANERRIQITNVHGFPLQPGIRTIVGGWSADEGAWAFWDPRRHSTFSPRSPSLQTTVQTLQAASHHGLGTQLRLSSQGREVVVSVTDEYLLWYLQEGESLHNADTEADQVSTLIDATPEVERELIDSSSTPDTAARRYELVQTMRAFREARFRPAVLRAYAYSCAVCATALKLVDAAHIVPVIHPQATDEVTNGLALCRLHHAAYDSGLIGVRSDFRVVINSDAVTRLRDVRLDGGLEAFRNALPSHIRVPNVIEVRPDPGKLRLGLEARQFPRLLIA